MTQNANIKVNSVFNFSRMRVCLLPLHLAHFEIKKPSERNLLKTGCSKPTFLN